MREQNLRNLIMGIKNLSTMEKLLIFQYARFNCEVKDMDNYYLVTDCMSFNLRINKDFTLPNTFTKDKLISSILFNGLAKSYKG